MHLVANNAFQNWKAAYSHIWFDMRQFQLIRLHQPQPPGAYLKISNLLPSVIICKRRGALGFLAIVCSKHDELCVMFCFTVSFFFDSINFQELKDLNFGANARVQSRAFSICPSFVRLTQFPRPRIKLHKIFHTSRYLKQHN